MSMFFTEQDRACRAILLSVWGETLTDPAHDIAHVERVVAIASRFAEQEKADISIVRSAAWLHDLVNLSKSHPERTRASTLSADLAVQKLREGGVVKDENELLNIHHAIAAHSYSANIPPKTLEAKILQDADRCDALGAIGVARVFAVTGQLGRALFDPEDPFAVHRPLDDERFGLDHFYTKLLPMAEVMNTKSGQEEATRRICYLKDFLNALDAELNTCETPGTSHITFDNLSARRVGSGKR